MKVVGGLLVLLGTVLLVAGLIVFAVAQGLDGPPAATAFGAGAVGIGILFITSGVQIRHI